eukprot:1175933-Prorocentrum_minimum.AAC.3
MPSRRVVAHRQIMATSIAAGHCFALHTASAPVKRSDWQLIGGGDTTRHGPRACRVTHVGRPRQWKVTTTTCGTRN